MGWQRRGFDLVKDLSESLVALGNACEVRSRAVGNRVGGESGGALTGLLAMISPFLDRPRGPIKVGIVQAEPWRAQDEGLAGRVK